MADDPTGGIGVAVAKHAAHELTSKHRWELETVIHPREELTSELPRVAPEALEHLDARSIVRIGTRVVPGMVLAGKIAKRSIPEEQSPEERKLGRMVGKSSSERDVSLRCPPDVRGRVDDVRFDDKRINVLVSAERELMIGDVLRLDDGREAAVAAISAELPVGVDVVWPGVEGSRLIAKISCAVDVLHARSIGPYSLVTQQPLGGKSSFGGQRVEGPQVDWLIARGATWTAHELMTVKSDDVEGRMKVYESIVRGAPECVSTIPRATRVLERELIALGFDVDFESPSVEISFLDDRAIIERMPGVVTKPETLNYSTYAPEPGGLFCEKIFGARDSDERATRMGHIVLGGVALHPWCFELASTLLAIPTKMMKKVLYGESTFAGEAPEKWQDTGAHAVQAALAAIDLRAIAAGEGARAVLARSLLDSRTKPEASCFTVWPVLPPDLRPLVPLAGGRFATSDLNDLYRQLINRTNRLKRLLELSAPDIILINEAAALQRALDALVENGLRQKKVAADGRPLVSLADMIQGPKGRIQWNLLGKRVDYSATAQVVPTAAIAPDRVLLPREVALEVFKPWLYEALERHGHVDTIKAAKKLVEASDPLALDALHEVAIGYPVIVFAGGEEHGKSFDVELWEEPAFGLAPEAIDQLGAVGTAVVHVPIDRRAVEEARTCLRRSSPRLVEQYDLGWIARAASFDRVAPVLVEAALQREVDPVKDPRAKIVLGRRVGA